MSERTQRYLFIISGHNQETGKLYPRLQEYGIIMEKLKRIQKTAPEFYLLYVASHVPDYALQSPDLIEFVRQETERGQEMLRSMGHRLAINPGNQFYAEGNADLKALQFSKDLNIHKIFGHSHVFMVMQKFYRMLERGLFHMTSRSHHSSRNIRRYQKLPAIRK